MLSDDSDWWRSAVIYQVYLRSFADGNGDGIGDIAGIRDRLPYLAALGVDALWINPWYPSPMADGGYDVADYRAVEPVFGSLDDATSLIREAHEHGLRVLLDLVPNHTSDQHVWFQAAVSTEPGSPARAHYLFRDGRGPDGAEPPNDWRSVFGGPAWTREPGPAGQWYLHLFAPEQPDLDWNNAQVRADATVCDHDKVGAPPTWVLSNHDVARHVSRYARAQDDRPTHSLQDLLDRPADVALGRARARAAALLMLALPGGAYVYQGEELGLEEVEDLPHEVLADPTWERSQHSDRGRDGCRVPLPWSGDTPPFGFGGTAWLPQPASWAERTAAAQDGVEGSFLELYRTALALRRKNPALGDGTLSWLGSPSDVLHFARSPGFACMVNLSAVPVPLPADARVLLASAPRADGRLAPDAAAWLATPG